MMNEALVKLVAVVKEYDQGSHRRQVLRGIHAQFNAGELVAIRGRSGSGKSTLLNCIAGIDEVSSGQVLIQGRDLSALRERERAHFRRDQLGFIFQFFNLIPTLTVFENILLPAELADRNKDQARRWGHELLARVGLLDRENDFPDQLSGGEQQRVALARALIQRPKLILADEPTGNLDRTSGELVMELILDLIQSIHGALILVTHSHHIASVADRQLQLVDGVLAPASAEQIGE